MRKLATIRKITAIDPIPNADAIEVATVDGWKAVVKKGDFKVGDVVVYLEIDSWVPQEIAPFLIKGDPKFYNGVAGERLRTLTLRGQLSQGLILPYDILSGRLDFGDFVRLGDPTYPATNWDVTDELGIQKWEAPFNADLAVGPWPTEIPKTDQERLQNLVREFLEWRTQPIDWEVTEKLEGQSGQFYLSSYDGAFKALSRNVNLKQDGNSSFWNVAGRYNIAEKLKSQGLQDLALQGEVVGPGIEGNIYGLKEYDFYLYDVYDAKVGKKLKSEARLELADRLGLKHVPVINKKLRLGRDDTVEHMLNYADGVSELNYKVAREGLVWKSLMDPNISWKVISNEYLKKQK